MKILSIETTCDDTSISIMEAKGGRKTLLLKCWLQFKFQIKIHIPYGGVFPSLAKREHLKNLPILLEKTLKRQTSTLSGRIRGIDLITVTSGPGLKSALWTGIVFAKELAEKWKVPLMPVNHMEGHICSVFGKERI